MSVRDWEVFHAIMRTGSLTRAGESLGISQPGVSQALRHLEDRLALRLFSRGHGRLVPTPEARALHPRTVQLLDQLGSLEGVARDLQQRLTGSVAIGCVPTLATALLPQVVASLPIETPQLRVRIDVLASAVAVERVESGVLDLAIVHAVPSNAGVSILGQVTTPMICMLPVDHPLAQHAALSPELIGDYPTITGRSALGSAVDAAFTRRGRVRQCSIDVNHSPTACALAAAGGGIALVSSYAASALLPNMTIRPFVPRIDLEIFVILPQRQPRSRMAEVIGGRVVDALSQPVIRSSQGRDAKADDQSRRETIAG